MTTKAKKPAKTSRDNLDLDLDARLDQATSTLSLDEEPVVGDALDQVLANAKKELDAVLPESDDILDLGNDFDLPEMDNLDSENDAEKTIPFQSESLASLESQLTAAMETPIISDDELDNLLGGSGYDFDSLLGDADDELTPDEAQLNEDSLLAAVDELLNFGFDLESEVEAVVEPEVVEIEPEVEAGVESEVVEIEPEIEAVVEPEVVEIEPEVEAVVEPEVVEIEPEVEAVVEPEVVEIEPEVEAVVEPEVVEIEPEVEAVVEPEVVEIEPEIEAVVEPEVVEIEPEIEAVVEPEVVEIEPEIEAVVEPEVVEIEPEVEAVVESEVVEIEPEVEAVVEPEVVEIEPEVEAVVEPEVVEIEPEVEAVVEPEVVEIEPEIEAVVEPEVVEIESRADDVDSELVELESDLNFEFESDGFLEPEVVAQDSVEIEESEMAIEEETTDFSQPTEIELTVEPEAALDDLVDSVPFEDTLKIDSNDAEIDDISIEEFNDFDNVADIVAPLVEISLPTDDELDVAQQLDGLNDAMENKNETTAGFDLLDDDAAEKEQATPVADSINDDMDWMKQLDDLDAADTEKETVAPVALEKTDVEPETTDDDMDWMKQLDDLDAADTAETVAPVALEKTDVEPETADDDDWMKQLDDLDAADTAEETVAPVALEKADAEPETADDDDWMKQLDDLDAADTTEETVAPVALEKADAEPETTDDDDWMKQLDDLGAEESPAEAATDDDDWMKQLDDADAQDHTAMSKENTDSIDDNFNIADAEPQHFNAAIDENALIAKAAEAAISQFKENQDHVVSQLRADQDSIESKTRKQFADAENNRKKSATFGYAALGVGIIGLLGSGAIGYFSYGTKTEADMLTQSVTALEEKVNAIVAKDPEKEKEIANIKTSVEQLNQKVEKLVAAQVAPVVPPVATAPVEVGKVPANGKTEPAKGNAVNLLNSKTPAVSTSTGAPIIDAPKVAETELVPPVDISPAHPVGENKAELKLSEMVKKPADDAKAKAEKAVKAEAEKAKEKADAALLTEKLAKATAVAKAAAATTKTDEQRKLLAETRASRYAGKMTRGMARGVEKERLANSSKVATTKTEARRAAVESKTKEILNTAVKPQKAAPAGKYSVNVVSYQQEWFAQSKAAEFRQKGIPVEVAPVDPNNYSTKYRLKVGGFKTKAEADAYAAKLKKSHGVNDTWTAAN